MVFLIKSKGLCQHPLLANWHYNPFRTPEHDRIFKLLLKRRGTDLQWNAKLHSGRFARHAPFVAAAVKSPKHLWGILVIVNTCHNPVSKMDSLIVKNIEQDVENVECNWICIHKWK